jgi:non-heme Fe2+,alpha-ketoglutarate-dependent halogenase
MSGEKWSDQLTSLELSEIYENGYLRPQPSNLDSSRVSAISKKLAGHMRKKDNHPLYGRHSVRDWHLVYPELVDFVVNERVLGALRSIMGEDLILWRSHLFFKPPNAGPVGWHQDFGSFSGEDIGNNKVSLVPTHLDDIRETDLEKYLPDMISQTASIDAPDQSEFWNMTVWVALTNITHDMGPLRFMKGSHTRRFPVRMEKINQSDFWQDPFVKISNKSELVDACNYSRLILDVDTSHLLDEVNVDNLGFDELKDAVMRKVIRLEGSTTVIDEVDLSRVVEFPMKMGDYILFSERTMHGSSANSSATDRLAINFRITRSSTLVYPSRLRDDYTDGFNLDIRQHHSLLISGQNLNPQNKVQEWR